MDSKKKNGMSTTVIKYENRLNELVLEKFNSMEYNVFFAIIANLQDENTEKISMTWDYIKKIANLENNHYTDEQFNQKLKNMNKKLKSIGYTAIIDEHIERDFVLFPTFDRDSKKKLLTVYIHPSAAYLINEVKKYFTMFELREFVQIDGKYAKNLYRLLKQYRNTGVLHITLEDIRNKLDIPKNYTNKLVTEKIITPAINTLEKYFDGLTFSTKRGAGRGRPMIGYEFRFVVEEVKKVRKGFETKSNSFCPELKENLAKKETKGYTKTKKKKGLPSFEYKRWNLDDLRKIIEKAGEDDDFDEEDYGID